LHLVRGSNVGAKGVKSGKSSELIGRFRNDLGTTDFINRNRRGWMWEVECPD